MGIALITGAGGLVGSTSVDFLVKKFNKVIGIENNSRKTFFGDNASIQSNLNRLETLPNFQNYQVDIRNYNELEVIFKNYAIDLIIHTAAQPSHDWSKNVIIDFNINANGSLNLLELTSQYCPNSVFIFTSTNKVYGDSPNYLPFKELETRYDLSDTHQYYNGIDESMSIDNSLHTFFGVSKAAADLLTQEYSKYRGLKTGVFRCGCITGKNHQGVELHGFLSYLVKCVVNDLPYSIFGYKGKQVRDNIHASDLVSAFYQFYLNPNPGNVYNMGGGRDCNCSVIEAIAIVEKLTNKSLNRRYVDENRVGDHQWWITNCNKFQSHYPTWKCNYNLENIILEIINEY